METPRPGILCIFNNIAPGSDEIFEQWFQHEHLAERLSVPGFLVGRRYEAISADRQFFNYYLTESAEMLSSDAYLARVNDPTPLSKKVMSEIFRDMVRTVCERIHATGDVRGSAAIAVCFHGQSPDEGALQKLLSELAENPAFAHGEIWRALDAGLPISEEERLRGGDARIAACLLIETLRVADAEKIAERIAAQFPQASTGVFRLLCEVRRDGSR